VSYDIDRFVKGVLTATGGGNTLFIITSDHGEGLNDHQSVDNSRFHGSLLYKSQLKVPLIFYHPHPNDSDSAQWLRKLFPRKFFRIEKERIAQPVRLLDLMPTVLDYLKIAIPSPVEGKSLLTMVYKDGPAPEMPPYIVAEATFRGAEKIAAYSEEWEYIENRDGHKGVNQYELQPIDVTENGKLTDKYREEKEASMRMKAYIQSWEKRYPKVEAVSPGQTPSQEEMGQLKSLGYIN
jgi:arylsulfatase A-like enzyme